MNVAIPWSTAPLGSTDWQRAAWLSALASASSCTITPVLPIGIAMCLRQNSRIPPVTGKLHVQKGEPCLWPSLWPTATTRPFLPSLNHSCLKLRTMVCRSEELESEDIYNSTDSKSQTSAASSCIPSARTIRSALIENLNAPGRSKATRKSAASSVTPSYTPTVVCPPGVAPRMLQEPMSEWPSHPKGFSRSSLFQSRIFREQVPVEQTSFGPTNVDTRPNDQASSPVWQNFKKERQSYAATFSKSRSRMSSPSVHTWNSNNFFSSDTDGAPSVHTFVHSGVGSRKVPKSNHKDTRSGKQPPAMVDKTLPYASVLPQQNSEIPCQGPMSETSGVSSRLAQSSAATKAPKLLVPCLNKLNFPATLAQNLCGIADCAVMLSRPPIPDIPRQLNWRRLNHFKCRQTQPVIATSAIPREARDWQRP